MRRVPAEEIYARTGIQLLEINTIYQLLAMRIRDDPQLAAADQLLATIYIPELTAELAEKAAMIERSRAERRNAEQQFAGRLREKDSEVERLRRLLENAGRIAARVAIDRARRRILRLALDAGDSERRAVGDAVMARRVLEPHRVVGRDRVEIGRGDVPPLGELAFIPAGALHPLAGLGAPDAIGDALDDVGDLRDRPVAEIDRVHCRRFGEMDVAVDEARRHGAALQIHHARLGTDERSDALDRSNGHDRSVPDGDASSHGVAGIDRQDVPVDEDEIRWSARGLLRTERREEHRRKRDPRQDVAHDQRLSAALDVMGSGMSDDTYAAMFTRSSSPSLATTGFIRSAHSPCRAPTCMSYICRTR